jgi:hypothetical protein
MNLISARPSVVKLFFVVSSVGLVVTELKTLAGGSQDVNTPDGTGTQAGFYHPYGVAVDSSSNIFVVERFAHRIRKVTPNGGMHEVHAFLETVIVLLCFFFFITEHASTCTITSIQCSRQKFTTDLANYGCHYLIDGLFSFCDVCVRVCVLAAGFL